MRRPFRRPFLPALLLAPLACGAPASDAGRPGPDSSGSAASPRSAPAEGAGPAAPPVVPRWKGGGPHPLAARIDSVFADFDRPGSPGCVVTVLRAGEVEYARGHGLANLETGAPLTTRTVFDGGSLTKQFTAFAVLLLAREGKLSLDDDVRRHVPEMADPGARVTLRHLLHHTSGVREMTELPLLAGNGRAEEALLMRQRGLNFAPGDAYLYSNSGYRLLGMVVERVSGQPLARFARERIFAPLGMTQTRYVEDPGAPVEGLALAYVAEEGGGYRLMVPGEVGTGDAGIATSPEDLAKWDRNFYDARVGGPEVVAALVADARLNDGRPAYYAPGLHTEPYGGLERRWHGGQSGGYRHQWWRFPAQRLSVLTMCNTRWAEPDARTERVTRIVLAPVLAPDSSAAGGATVPAAALERHAGLYVGRATQSLRPLRFRDGKLEMRLVATWYTLLPQPGGDFRVLGLPLRLVFTPGGEGGWRMEERVEGETKVTVFDRAPEAPPGRGELAGYAGLYHSADLGATWRAEPRGDSLAVRMESGETMMLGGAGPDALSDGYRLVLAERDPRGRVAALVAATPRARGVRFVRRP